MPNITYPYTFANGTLAQAPQVNANFNAVTAVVNGALTNSNLASSAAIALSKLGLNPGSTAFNQSTSGQVTWSSGLTTDTQPQIAMTSNAGLQFGPGGSTAPDISLKRSAVDTLQVLIPGGGAGIFDGNGGTLQNFSNITLASGGVFNLNSGSISGTSFPMINSGRLYLTSGNPYLDTGASTSILFGPFNGYQITLYNGTAEVTQSFSEVSLAVGSLSTSSMYDIYVKSASPTTVVLSAVAWGGLNTPPTRGVQDGRLTKNGDATSLLVGAIYLNASSAVTDNTSTRGVSNLYNTIARALYAADANATAPGGSVGPVDGSTTDGTGRISFASVLGNSAYETTYMQQQSLAGSSTAYAGIGINSITTFTTVAEATGTTSAVSTTATYANSSLPGYTYIQKLGQTTVGSVTFTGTPYNSLTGLIMN